VLIWLRRLDIWATCGSRSSKRISCSKLSTITSSYPPQLWVSPQVNPQQAHQF
jgi:hypothetical protein